MILLELLLEGRDGDVLSIGLRRLFHSHIDDCSFRAGLVPIIVIVIWDIDSRRLSIILIIVVDFDFLDAEEIGDFIFPIRPKDVHLINPLLWHLSDCELISPYYLHSLEIQKIHGSAVPDW